VRHRSIISQLVATLLVSLAACYGGGPLGSSSLGNGNNGGDGGASNVDGGGSGPLPFTPDPPNVYVAKAKNILVGLPPTDDEIAKVTADPTQLGALVDTWMTYPEYQTKMMRFFELAFQQTQIGESDFSNMLQPGQLQLDMNTSTQSLMVQNQQEVFARTMLALADANQPFTQAMTTQSYMMTTAMRVFYALTDVWQLDNGIEGIHDYFAGATPTPPNIVVESTTAIPLSETLDPTDAAHYMHWYDPGSSASGCTTITYPPRANTLYNVLLGHLDAEGSCKSTTTNGQLTAGDFSDWSMVTIQQPTAGQKTTNFYDLTTLRAASTTAPIILNRPYLGYYTTPAFFANWQTNASNEMRVTLNQTLIVATGAQIDGTDGTVPTSTPGLDTTHAIGPCVGCHQLLDPTRSIFSSTFSWYYGTQLDPTWNSQPGRFVFEGVQAPMSTIYDFGKILSNHHLVASGWAQKLCYYMDSEACVATDPEFVNIVNLFQTSNYSWNALVKAVVTSPITTHAVTSLTATTNGEIVAVSRRDHLCAALNARLGFADICGLNAALADVAPKTALAIVPGLPSDGYGRGSVVPVLPNQPSLFYRAGVENFCELIAPLVIDPKTPIANAKSWSSSDPTSAISDFVSLLIGLPPSDPRAAPVQKALSDHYTAALADTLDAGTKVTATEALQSTFIAACLAPSLDSMGM
jgi:hypothetical protein